MVPSIWVARFRGLLESFFPSFLSLDAVIVIRHEDCDSPFG